jgi:hypothetical protein
MSLLGVRMQGSRVLVLVLALGVGCAAQTALGVRKVFVKSFGDDETAVVIRAKIVDRLMKTGKVTLVESVDEAEGVLSGIAVMTEALDYEAAHVTTSLAEDEWRMNRNPVVAAILASPAGQVLWQGEAAPRLLGPSNQVSDVVGQITAGLVRAIEHSKSPSPRGVRSIAVGRFNGYENAQLIRIRLMGRLHRSRRVLVFDSANGADATLTGVVEAVSVYKPGSSYSGNEADGTPYVSVTSSSISYRGTVGLRMAGAQGGEPQRVEASRTGRTAWGVTSRLCDQAARKILRLIDQSQSVR